MARTAPPAASRHRHPPSRDVLTLPTPHWAQALHRPDHSNGTATPSRACTIKAALGLRCTVDPGSRPQPSFAPQLREADGVRVAPPVQLARSPGSRAFNLGFSAYRCAALRLPCARGACRGRRHLQRARAPHDCAHVSPQTHRAASPGGVGHCLRIGCKCRQPSRRVGARTRRARPGSRRGRGAGSAAVAITSWAGRMTPVCHAP